MEGAPVGEAVFAWNCGYVDAWYPGFGWRNVEGGPAASVPLTEGVIGSSGWTEGAGSVAIVGNVENIVRGDQVISWGNPDAPAHLWAWRPPSEPPSAVPVTPTDVEWAVNGFVGAWGPGYDPYLATYATSEVIEALRAGSGGLPSMEGWTYRSWNIWEPVEVEPGIYEVNVVLHEEARWLRGSSSESGQGRQPTVGRDRS